MSQLRASEPRTIRYDWRFVDSFSDRNLETFMRQKDKEYRTIKKSGIDSRNCQVCENNIDKHKMMVWYEYCSSVRCHWSPSDNCGFRFKIHECSVHEINYLYDNQIPHLNKYHQNVDKVHGMHSSMKDEIKIK